MKARRHEEHEAMSDATNTDPIRPEPDENARVGSDYDAETADLVRHLLAGGYTPTALAATLAVDDDTLRRWRRGVQAGHLARKAMRLLLVVRHIAPSLLADVSMSSVDELFEHLASAQMRWVSLDEIERRREIDRKAEEFRRAPKSPSRWAAIQGVQWRDGAERGGP